MFLLDCNVNNILIQIFIGNIIDSIHVEAVFIKIAFLFNFKIILYYVYIGRYLYTHNKIKNKYYTF